MRLLRQSDIETCLPMTKAIRLMGQAFTAISDGSAVVAERQALDTPCGTALLMGATGPGRGVAAKLVTVIPGNQQRNLPVSSGLALLLDERDGQPLALLDATALTAWRTAAAAGFATALLARQEARRGLLVGCGTQARSQLIAMDTARKLEEIRVYARKRERGRALIDAVQPECSAQLKLADILASAAGEADIITAATTSTTPVIEGNWVAAGCHVNGIGSFRPDMCEFDDVLVEKAQVYVESLATAEAEAGELVSACRSGMTAVSCWYEVGEVIRGNAPGRSDDQGVSFYKSVGHAIFDLFAASEIYQEAERRELGTQWIV